MFQEEKSLADKKLYELRVQLNAITEEIKSISQSSKILETQVQTAVSISATNPGVYHLVFFENVLQFLRDFRRKIEDANIWLGATNKRAEKKNYWSMYKKKGSSFLLSPDHYLQRSAG